MSIESECNGECAVDLDGMVELAHPGCRRHYHHVKCPVHGGEWAIWQCNEEHPDEVRALYKVIVEAQKESIRVGVEAAIQMALYGSAFIQVDRRPGETPKVTVLSTPDVILKKD